MRVTPGLSNRGRPVFAGIVLLPGQAPRSLAAPDLRPCDVVPWRGSAPCALRHVRHIQRVKVQVKGRVHGSSPGSGAAGGMGCGRIEAQVQQRIIGGIGSGLHAQA